MVDFQGFFYLCFLGIPGMKLNYSSRFIVFTMCMLENIQELLPVSTHLSRLSLWINLLESVFRVTQVL